MADETAICPVCGDELKNQSGLLIHIGRTHPDYDPDFENELRERIQGLDQDHIRCRDLGHIWREFVPSGASRPKFGWRRSLRCDPKRGGCGAERHEVIDMQGNIDSRNYRYPDGYEMRGLGRQGGLSKHYFRREYLVRLGDSNLLVKAGAEEEED